MKHLLYCSFFVFYFGVNGFSQTNYQYHTVVKGETVSGIAKKYAITVAEIYRINPTAKNNLRVDSVIQIPLNNIGISQDSKTLIVEKTSEKTHRVLPKETIYGISKLYNCSIEELYRLNPSIKSNGVQIDQIIAVPYKNKAEGANNSEFAVVSNSTKIETAVASPNLSSIDFYEVLPKESLYSIAKKFGLSLAQLKSLNPELSSQNVRIGQKLKVPKMNVVAVSIEHKTIDEVVAVKPKSQAIDAEANTLPAVDQSIIHEVQPYETKYGIAKKYNITVYELERQNPTLQGNLLAGSIIKLQGVPSSKSVENIDKTEVSAVESSNDNKEDLAVKLIEKASENIGVRYRYGGTTKDGFDCSGLLCNTFGAYDILLPRTSIEMASQGEVVNMENAMKGDLIFFRTGRSSRINHVGMVVEVAEGEVKFIHASTTGGVMISSTKESYYEQSLAQINRVL